MIPGASKATVAKNPAPNSICGQGAGLVSATGTTSVTVCSKYLQLVLLLKIPIIILFVGDVYCQLKWNHWYLLRVDMFPL